MSCTEIHYEIYVLKSITTKIIWDMVLVRSDFVTLPLTIIE